MVLDEPYANLDHMNVRRVRAALRKIHRQQLGVIVCEHRLALTAADVREMIIIKDGQLVLHGAPDELLKEDVEYYGLEPPLAVQIGRRLNLTQLPLDTPALKAMHGTPAFPAELKPMSPKPFANNSPVVVEMENVSFEMEGNTILQDISLTLHRGECMAIVGTNGAGKTTLLKHLNGLLRPSHGLIRIMGDNIAKTKVSHLAAYVGMAFQNPDNQFFKLSVWDEISVGAKSLNRFDESWLLELVDIFSLKPLLERSPYSLSGGEKKRVAFAAALACKPEILALDEPTAGQDYSFRIKLGRILNHLQERGQAILLVTHDLSFAQQYANSWQVLSQGQIVAQGSPWDIMADDAVMQRAGLEPTEAFSLYGSREE
jgi:energy-coupling factor transport system ATP-binding protein